MNLVRVETLRNQLLGKGIFVTPTVSTPDCRDPKDLFVLAAAIEGRADAIVSSDGDLRADDKLIAAMADYGVKIWGVDRFLNSLTPL